MAAKKEYSFIFDLPDGIVCSGETEQSLVRRFDNDQWSDETREELRKFMEIARAGHMLHVKDVGGYSNIIVCNYAGPEEQS